MPKHNVQSRSPEGEVCYAFDENKSMADCRLYLRQLKAELDGEWPKGWTYQIVNLNKEARKRPEFYLITGWRYDTEGNEVMVDERRAGIRTERGWYTTKKAKRDMRAQGASFFTKHKVYTNGDDSSEYSLG